MIYAGVNGFLDGIDIKEVTNFEKDLIKSLNSNGKNILEIIQKEQSLSKETEEKLNVFIAEISEKYKKD